MSWHTILKENPYDWIKEQYKKWGRETRISGDEIGAKGTLLNLLKNHVKKQRSGGSRIDAYVILNRMGPMMGKSLTKSDYNTIISLIPYLERMENSDHSNPANIYFTAPLRVKKGKPMGKKKFYGHWRTAHYAKIREGLGKDFVPTPVHSDWYSTKRNEAKPPMWQALFADKNNNSSSPVVTKGLLPILKEYKKHVEANK